MGRSGGDEDDDERNDGSDVFEEGLMSIGEWEKGGKNENDSEKKERERSGRKGELDLATSNGSETEADERNGSNNEEEIVFVKVKKVGGSRKEEKGNKKSS